MKRGRRSNAFYIVGNNTYYPNSGAGLRTGPWTSRRAFMRMSRLTLAALAAGVALTILGLPEAAAQEEQCVGTPPKGGKWVASGELYLNRARNPKSACRKVR